MSTTPLYDTDVFIVGAGPVGLTLAAELIRHGVSCHIVDKTAGTKHISKALILHVRTQEVFDAMGLIDATKAQAVPLRVVEVSAYRKRLGRWLLDGVNSPRTHPLIIGQDRTEHLLEDHLHSLGGQVAWNAEAIALGQDEDGVSVTVRHANGEEQQLRARYLIGCEGSDSLARKTLGIPFEGDRYEGEQFIQADCKIRWTEPRGRSHLYLTEQGYMMVIEMPDDVVRVFISLPDTNPNDKSDPTLDEVQRHLRRLGADDAELFDPVWLARYRTSHRRAARFHQGRVFLAGDAGHVHVPIGGQGMNTGIQDAFNLAWKLAAVLRGSAKPSLLDSYNAERHPVAEQLLSGTDRAYRFVLKPGEMQKAALRILGPFVMRSPLAQSAFRNTLEEVTIAYPHSPLTSDHGGSGGPAAGERALDAPVVQLPDRTTVQLFDLLRGTHWTLLVFAGHTPTAAVYGDLADLVHTMQARGGAWLQTHLVAPDTPPARVVEGLSVLVDRPHLLHEAYGVHQPCLYLVRPDWAIGFRGTPAHGEHLLAYFDATFSRTH